jgi:hypothetical protein
MWTKCFEIFIHSWLLPLFWNLINEFVPTLHSFNHIFSFRRIMMKDKSEKSSLPFLILLDLLLSLTCNSSSVIYFFSNLYFSFERFHFLFFDFLNLRFSNDFLFLTQSVLFSFNVFIYALNIAIQISSIKYFWDVMS